VAFIAGHADRRSVDGLRWGVEPICRVLSEHGVPIAPSSHYRLAALLAALVITLTSCTSEGSDGAPKATDIPSSPSASQFVSERHSYHLEVPAGWKVVEYGGTWTDFAQFRPGAEVPGEDVVSAPDGSGFLVSNSMAIPHGMSPREWLAELERLVTSGPTKSCRESTDTDVVAGEQATITQHRCADMDYVGRSLTHAERGYYFTMGFQSGDPTTKATLEGVVASIGFAVQ
jgi:hypothetical protein